MGLGIDQEQTKVMMLHKGVKIEKIEINKQVRRSKTV